jgi:hypothetical protein
MMTAEAQRIAIAETCGWNDIRSYTYSDDGTQGLGAHRAGTPNGCWTWLPDYLNDLNDMHAAIAALPMEQQWSVFTALAHCVDSEKPAFMGSAAEYAEAFLRVIGKWQ